ncbi:MAG TPA: tetratricopeptide repeat protein [Bryobacteraceae bacterium]|jgi:tetratricopeptide (TPR) repeat protein|nr:tetratricopeptide repeat protein [Bryobacteraceae bacterium]
MRSQTIEAPEVMNWNTFLRRLRSDLAMRRISSGLDYLEQNQEAVEALDSTTPQGAASLGVVARWVDSGYAGPATVRNILERFPKDSRSHLPLADYLQLRISEALVAMAEEEAEEAIRHLDFILSTGEEAGDKELLAIAYFWKARCRRYQAEYDQALECVTKGCALARELGYEPLAALMQVLESWLYFQKGKYKESIRVLQEAEQVLGATDDYITLGNIHSAYGRLARREGRYEPAIAHFEEAIEAYRKRDPRHRNYARTLANIATVKRLIALQIRRQLDDALTRRRKEGPKNPGSAIKGGAASTEASYRRRFEELRQEALAALGEAALIYHSLPHHRGSGTVRIDRGYLYLDGGELEQAEIEAGEAYELGHQKQDYILMSRARILQCMVEHAKLDEGIEEGSNPGRHAQLARDYAREAVEAAKHTQNRWLLARAYTWEGLTHCNPFFNARDLASQSCSQASALLKPDDYDYLWDELQMLKAKLLVGGSIDATLRAWSQGVVGEKTFRQISDEFAEIIIPKVWEAEDRKIARVASRLSISPKKVRRILQKVGLLKGRPAAE